MRLEETIGAVARAARQRHNLTQADVAERVGIASEVYGRMERGLCMPSVRTLARMAGALGFSADEALGLDAPGTSPLRPLPPKEFHPSVRLLLRRARALGPKRARLLARLAAALS